MTAHSARSPLHRREYAELIVRRAEHLPPEDRVLIEAVFADGRTVRELGALTGEEPRKLGRRIRRLTRRVLSDRFIFVVSHRDSWPAIRRRLATACIVNGQSMKEAAAGARTSFYNARKQIDAVHALLDSIMQRRTIETQRHREEEG